MKTQVKGKAALSDILAAVLLGLLLLLVVLVHRTPGFEPYPPAVNPFFLMQPEEIREESISGYAGVSRTYTFTVQHDEAVRRGASLYVWLRHTNAAVWLDGELRLDTTETDTPHIGHTPGNYWLTVPLHEEDIGKTLTVRLTPVYNNVRDTEPVFFQISRDTLMSMMLLPQDLPMLSLGAAAVISGLFIGLLVFVFPMEREDKRKIFYLGGVTVCAGIWKLCSMQLLLLMLDRYGWQKELWYIPSSCYVLMLVLSLRFLCLMRTRGENRIGTVCFVLSACTAIIMVLLQFAGLVELHEMLVGFGFLMAAMHLISLLGEKPTREELLWLLPTFLALGLDLLFYAREGKISNAPFFLCWILLNLFIHGFGLIRNALLREKLLRKQEEELRDAKIRTMINQIRPHFIYNTLVSIYALCEDDPKRAMTVVQNFTTYLQANFTALTAKELIAFPVELENTRAYIAVEEMLFEGKLFIAYDIGFTAFRLPPMTLQPVVENAVKYGVGKGAPSEHILIRTRVSANAAVISIEDNGPGFDPEAVSGDDHIGLQNVRERLAMMCGGTMDVHSMPGMGTVVTIKIPLAAENGDETADSAAAS